MQSSVPGITSIVDTLAWRAEHQADRRAFTFLHDDGVSETHLTYGELFARAAAIAWELQRRNATGERVLLLYPPGEHYVVAIFGCMLAGAAAVPAYPPQRSTRTLARVTAIAADARPIVALTTRAMEALLPAMEGVAVVATDAGPPQAPGSWHPPRLAADGLAILQYTSGSTRTPRGVMVTHANLQHNMSLICRGFRMSAEDRGVIWLPSYHDMGLVGGVLTPVHVGFPVLLMAPSTFIQRPIRWLNAIARHRATISGGPNFAFDLCLARTNAEDRQALDLSSWRVAFTGAEPIRPDTLERFADAFAVCGFRHDAFYPCYGLAEATLIVTGGEGPAAPVVARMDETMLREGRCVESAAASGARAFVACGRPMRDMTVAIVQPDTCTRCMPGEIGEIWLDGPSRARGYWNAPEETTRVFDARLADESDSAAFLRTGDLGFLRNGELFVTGRLKDLLVLYGHNHYPSDIEWTVEHSHAMLAPNAAAAVSVEVDNEERLVIVAELTRSGARQQKRGNGAASESAIRAIRDAIAREHELPVHAVVLVGPLAIPRTSSGKIQRYRCREAYLDGTLEPLARWDAGSAEISDEPTTASRERIAQTLSIEEWLVRHVAEVTGVTPDEIDRDQAFAYLGLTSLQAVALTDLLAQELQRPLSAALAYDYPTIASLARHLAGATHASISPEGLGPAQTSARAAASRPVAIVGMACRLPGAPDIESFWKLLADGVDATTELPADRRSIWKAYEDAISSSGNPFPLRGGFLPSVDGFDPEFFGIMPREAASIDPQQRLLLELAAEALEDAGQPCEAARGSRIGVFIGIASSDYSRLAQSRPDRIDPYAGTGNAQSIAANRISYAFDLRGPSLAVDTACSSSLVALHLACESLRAGECGMALVGGVNMVLAPAVSATFANAGFLAPDGCCKAFDARADGYARGEGAGVVVVKPLARALEDGDRIYAIVRGSAVSNDGRTNGLTAPSRSAQEAVLRDAYTRAGVAPSRVQYVEAHGTGTSLGDPIEVESLGSVVGQGRDPGDVCALGSVKTNVGHLEAAAGIVGLMKTVLALEREQLPPSLHFEAANPRIPFDRLPLRVQQTLSDWPRNSVPRVAGVSSFGFGGTNAHVVLEEAPAESRWSEAEADAPELQLLTLSATRPDALRTLADAYAQNLKKTCDGVEQRQARAWRDVCHTAAVRRTQREYRLAVIADRSSTAADLLGAFVRGEHPEGVVEGRAIRASALEGGADESAGTQERRSMLDAFAAAYVKGRDIDWRRILPTGGRVVSLPMHPWRRQRYWIESPPVEAAAPNAIAWTRPDEARTANREADGWTRAASLSDASAANSSKAAGHPLLGRRIEIASASVCVWQGVVSAQRFSYFLDHRFQGVPLVPGTTYVEMAVAAALQAFGPKPLELSNIKFQSPLVLSNDATRETQIVLSTVRADGPARGAEFQIFSRPLLSSANEAWTLHAAGAVSSHAEDANNGNGDSCAKLAECDRAAFQASASEQLSGDHYFAELKTRGFDYGPAFRGLRVVWRCAGEALGRLELPETLQPDIASYHLHPALLDAGAQLLVATDHGVGRPFLPVGVDRVRVFPGAGRPEWGHAVYRAPKADGLPGFHGDVRLFDATGTLVAEATGLNVRYLEAEAQQARGRAPAEVPPWSQWLYEPQWEPRRPDDGDPRPAVGVWLILCDATGVGERLASALRQMGNKCLVAVASNNFGEAIGDGPFRVRAEQRDDLSALLDAALASEPHRLRGIVHLWNLDASPMRDADVSAIRAADQRGIGVSIAIAQMLATHKQPEPTRLWIVTRGAQRIAGVPAAPEAIQAPAWGLGRTLFQEHPDLAGALVDLDPNDDADAAAADVIRALGAKRGDSQSAFRAQVRYAPSLVRVPASTLSKPTEAATSALPLGGDASYLITGGLGGLGLSVAHWLAEHGARQLILVGRAQIPSRAEWDDVAPGTRVAEQIAAVRALEARGASIEIASLDVSDESDLRAMLDRRAGSGLPPIRGVVHAAGVVQDEILLRVNASTLDALLKAKVIGGWVLDRCFSSGDLDFFVLFSSAASLMGSAGQGAYAAANAFLDALAHRRQGLGRRALSVNWGPWAGAGMAVNTEAAARLAARGIGSIPPSIGLDLFGRLLHTSTPQIGIIAVDWDKAVQSFPELARSQMLERLLREEGHVRTPAEEAPGAHRRVAGPREAVLAASPGERPALVESLLRGEIAAVSGIDGDSIDPRRPLDDLGIDSLASIDLKARLESAFEISIPVVRLLELPTLSGLATLVVEALQPAADAVAKASEATASAASPVPTKVVVIRRAGADAPLFCVHPGALEAECYTVLAQDLGNEPPFYALQPAELDYKQQPSRDLQAAISIDRVAQGCLDAIRTVQPFGPYRLAGWSLGGVVAFETARRLNEHGESVALLALFDSPAPATGPIAEWEDAALIRMFAGYLGARRGRQFVLPLNGGAPDTGHELLRLTHHAITADLLPSQTGVEQIRALYETYRDGIRAGTELLRRYRPMAYPGRLVYFRATDNANLPGYALPNAATIWGGLSAGMDVHPVPGSHYTLFLEPHARALAARLKEYL
jgi:acyl transferase domain-containing protein/acyl-CoA synthetase (AMP-forming)/AMP-acid ligase II/thioesterase domain-containing protein/acyl carrier protein